jgi:hypothetical protein
MHKYKGNVNMQQLLAKYFMDGRVINDGFYEKNAKIN